MLVDSHCHLDFNDFEEDFEDMLARARENGVTAMLNAGNNIDELDKQLEISEKYPFIIRRSVYIRIMRRNIRISERRTLLPKLRIRKSLPSANAVWIITTITARKTYKLKFLLSKSELQEKPACR